MNIHDVAKIAGVSASTVSKVMNGKDKDISEATRKKVLAVIEEEQYVPYLKFREKEGIKSHLIGLILRRDNRERERIAAGAEKAATEKGYGILIRYTGSDREIENSIEDMIRKKVSGLLIDTDEWMPAGKLEEYTVYLNQTKEFDDRQKVTFYYRLSEAGKLAAERLMQEGHEKIACITMPSDKRVQDGYKMAMREANLPIQQLWLCEGDSPKEIEKYGVQQCLSGNVTAVICGSPEIAVSFWKVMQKTRTVFPDSISVIVIGDNPMMEIAGDGITAVRLPAGEMSRDAADYLIGMISEDRKTELMRKFSSTIKERKSIAPPPQEKQGEKIVVVGNMNMDVTMGVSRIPVNGETQIAEKLYVFPGGKGGNQAVGAGKLGGQVYLIGCLGNDMDGKQLYSSLIENHVHADGVLFDNSLPSGKAYVSVDQNGESTIVIYQGANKNLSINQVNQFKYLFENARFCLVTLEIPEAIVEYTVKFCKRNGTEVILKPSAVESFKEELLKDITYFIPNENELHTFVPGEGSIEEKAAYLREKGVEHVIVTLGSRGCYLQNETHSMYFEGTGFEAVDTTGGADSFISALAVYLSEGRDLIHAIGFAVYASGISVTRPGVQPALPDRKAVDIYEEEIDSRYFSKGREKER